MDSGESYGFRGDLRLWAGGQEAGVLRFLETAEAVKLELVMVPRRFRRLGFGRSLVCRLLKYADALDKPVLVTARPIGGDQTVDRLAAFYARLGFEFAGRGLTVIHMRREPRRQGAGCDEALTIA